MRLDKIIMKLLPKSVKNPRGFTLIELLVVIAIIAILALIGIALLTGTQARARNSKRRQEVKAIATALEVNKTPSSPVYPTQIKKEWFSGQSIPNDPRPTGAKYNLLYATTGGVQITDPVVADWPAANDSPAGTSVPATVTAVPLSNATGPFPTVAEPELYVFSICALLEPEAIGSSTSSIFCVQNSQ